MLTSVCPSCSSGKVEPNRGEPLNHPYRCTDCGSTFVRPMVTDTGGALGEEQEIAEAVSAQLFRGLFPLAEHLGRTARDVGLVGAHDSEALALIMRAGCIGAHRAMLLEAERIGRARAEGTDPKAN